jgi:hypothetical protein
MCLVANFMYSFEHAHVCACVCVCVCVCKYRVVQEESPVKQKNFPKVKSH